MELHSDIKWYVQPECAGSGKVIKRRTIGLNIVIHANLAAE